MCSGKRSLKVNYIKCFIIVNTKIYYGFNGKVKQLPPELYSLLFHSLPGFKKYILGWFMGNKTKVYFN